MEKFICNILLFCVFVLKSTFAQGSSQDQRLLLAAYKGGYTEVKLALDSGADVNARGFYGQTALHLAASNGDAKMVLLLLKKKADLHAKDRNGLRAIKYAKKFKFSFVAKFNKNKCDSVLQLARKNKIQPQSPLSISIEENCKNLRDLSYRAEHIINILGRAAEDYFISHQGLNKKRQN